MEIGETDRPFVGKGHKFGPKKEKNTSNHIERYMSLPINSPKRKNATWGAKSRAGKIIVKGIGEKKVEIPLFAVELKSKWKTGPIIVGVMDSLPMGGKSLLLGSDLGAQTTFARKKTKLNTTNGRDRTKMRENSSRAQDLARRNLSKAQDKMKERFQGLYTVARKIDSINYELNAPRRRKKIPMCHVDNLENKLANLEKLRTCRGGKLDNQNRDLFSNIAQRNKIGRHPLKMPKL